MGRPFKRELAKLPVTYEWALVQDVRNLGALLKTDQFPLLAIGSGGSLSAAQFVAHLHGALQRRFAKAATPLQIMVDSVPTECTSLFLTAQGRNSDILAAFNSVLEAEVKKIGVLCLARNSPIAKLAKMQTRVELIEFELPTGTPRLEPRIQSRDAYALG